MRFGKNCLAVSIALKDKYKRKGYGKIMLEKTLKKKRLKCILFLQ